ncbi:MAG: ABC transporter permease [Bacteroidetes bacterium]|nr:ABC transporter permease [Bacteroidota bacterium]
MSGIVVGIAAVVTVLSIGKGHEEKIQSQINRMGADIFWVSVQRSSQFEGNIAFSGGRRTPRTTSTLTGPDADAVRDRCNAVTWCAPVFNSMARGMLNEKDLQLNVVATTPEYRKVRALNLVAGRYLVDQDVREVSDVCVIEEIAGVKCGLDEDNYIYLDSRKLRIVGILKPDGLQLTAGNSATVHIPLTLSQSKLTGSDVIHSIYCRATKGSLDKAKRQVEEALNSRTRGLARLEMRGPRDLFSTAESMTRTATMVTAGIGMISLFVGGIGIMNILLASVFERINEIGLRRSLGARKWDVLSQFLYESIAFSVCGGIVGVLAGTAVTESLTSFIDIPAVFSFESVVIALFFSCALGVIFGVYPAWKAASINPVEALRYE